MKLALVSLVLGFLFATASAAQAPPPMLLVLTRDGHLLRVDTSTASTTMLANTGLSNVLALERGAGGVYYAIADWNRLYAVDPANGRSRLVSTLPYSFVVDLAQEPVGSRIFGAADADAAGDAESLVEIDPIAKTSARIGAFEDPDNAFDVPLFAFGLAFSSGARLFGSLFAISPADALIATIDPASGKPMAGVSAPGILSGLDFGPDEALYGVEQIAVGSTSGSFAVVIEPGSGAVTRISGQLGLEAAPGDCANGVDDDLDGASDGDDPGCQVWALDAGTAIPDCRNGLDDDGDGLVDLADPGCQDVGDVSERAIGLPCDDGLDNDGDGAIDATGTIGAAADPQCGGSPLGHESAPACGLGAELLIVLPLLRAGISRARGRAGRRA